MLDYFADLLFCIIHSWTLQSIFASLYSFFMYEATHLQDQRIVKYEIWLFVCSQNYLNKPKKWVYSFHFTWSWFWKMVQTFLENIKVVISISKSQFVDPIRIQISEFRNPTFKLSHFWQDLKSVQLLLHSTFSPLYLWKQSKHIWGSSLFYLKSVSILHIKTIKKYLGIKSVLCKECKHFT